MFETDNIFEGAFTYIANRPGTDGLSFLQHEQKRQEEQWARDRAKEEALMQREMDSMPIPCIHYPECPGEYCRDTAKARKQAQDEYDKTMAIIDAEAAPKKPTPAKPSGPSTIKSKAAVAALSQPKSATAVKDPIKKPTAPPAKPPFGAKSIVRPKTRTPAPKNPSPMRHTASTVASRSTLGHAKGRAISANIRRANQAPKKSAGFVPFEERDASIAPAAYLARYGEPPLGSDMWLNCWKLGILEDSPKKQQDEAQEDRFIVDELLRDEALDDFQLTLDD